MVDWPVEIDRRWIRLFRFAGGWVLWGEPSLSGRADTPEKRIEKQDEGDNGLYLRSVRSFSAAVLLLVAVILLGQSERALNESSATTTIVGSGQICRERNANLQYRAIVLSP